MEKFNERKRSTDFVGFDADREEAARWLFARLGYVGNPEAQRAEALRRWPWLAKKETSDGGH